MKTAEAVHTDMSTAQLEEQARKSERTAPVFIYPGVGQDLLDWDTGQPIEDQANYSGRVMIYFDSTGKAMFETTVTELGRHWNCIKVF